jgi:hypothetical protein
METRKGFVPFENLLKCRKKNALFCFLATHARPDRCLIEQSQFVVIAGVSDAFNVKTQSIDSASAIGPNYSRFVEDALAFLQLIWLNRGYV